MTKNRIKKIMPSYKRSLAAFCAVALTLGFFSFLQMPNFALGEGNGVLQPSSTQAYIVFNDMDNTVDITSPGAYDVSGRSIESIPATVTGEGNFVVSLNFETSFGDMFFGIFSPRYFALEIKDGEVLFPNHIIQIMGIRSIDEDGVSTEVTVGRGYTAGVNDNTRFTFFNYTWETWYNETDDFAPLEEWLNEEGDFIDEFFAARPDSFPGDNVRSYGTLADTGFSNLFDGTYLMPAQSIEIEFNFLHPGTSTDIAHLIIQQQWWSAPNPHDVREFDANGDLSGRIRNRRIAELNLIDGNTFDVMEGFQQPIQNEVNQITLAIYRGARTFNGAQVRFNHIWIDGIDAIRTDATEAERTRSGFHSPWGDDSLPYLYRFPIITPWNERPEELPLPALDPDIIGFTPGQDYIWIVNPFSTIEVCFDIIPLSDGPDVTASIFYRDPTFTYMNLTPEDNRDGIRADNVVVRRPGRYAIGLTFTGESRPRGVDVLAVSIFGAEQDDWYKGYNIRIGSVRINGIEVLPPLLPRHGSPVENKIYRRRGVTYPFGENIRYDVYSRGTTRPPPGSRVYDGRGLTGTSMQTIPVDSNGYILVWDVMGFDENSGENIYGYIPITEIRTIVIEFDFIFGIYTPIPPIDQDIAFSGTYCAFLAFTIRPDYTHRSEWNDEERGKFINNDPMQGLNPRFARMYRSVPALDTEPRPPTDERLVNYRGTFVDAHRIRATIDGNGRPEFNFNVSMTLPQEPFIPLPPTATASRHFVRLAVSTNIPIQIWHEGLIADDSRAVVTIAGTSFTVQVGGPDSRVYGQDDNGFLTVNFIHVWRLNSPSVPDAFLNSGQTVSIDLRLIMEGIMAEPGPERIYLRTMYDWLSRTEQGSFNNTTWSAFQTQLVNAGNILNNGGATQVQINNAYNLLIESFRNLNTGGGINRDMLQTLVAVYANTPPHPSPSTWEFREYSWESFENFFNESSWSAFISVHGSADRVLEDMSATQTEINDAKLALMRAISNLTSAPESNDVDREALRTKVNYVRFLGRGDYSYASWTRFWDARQHAIDVLADPFATQSDVDSALYELIAAYNALDTGSDTGGCGCGNGNVVIGLIVLTVVLAGATIFLKKHKQ